MAILTSKERLHRLYYHKESDRPGVHCRSMIPKNDPTYDRLKKLIDEKTDKKWGWDLRHLESKYEIKEAIEAYSEDFKRRKLILKTPAGELFMSEMLGQNDKPGYIEKHWLVDEEDANKYLSLPKPKITRNINRHFELLKEAGDRGIVEVGFSNPAGFVAELFGSENFAMMSIAARDLVLALMERETSLILKSLKYALKKGAGPFISMSGEEYITPPLHGPKDFADFNVKYDKQIIDVIHEAKGAVHIHSHGSIKKVLPLFMEAGTDVLHPFEAPPMGDVTAVEAKAIIGDSICFEGNIQIADMYEKSSENIRSQTEALIKTVYKNKTGLIVCPSASPYMVGEGEKCYNNFKVMIETVTGV